MLFPFYCFIIVFIATARPWNEAKGRECMFYALCVIQCVARVAEVSCLCFTTDNRLSMAYFVYEFFSKIKDSTG